MSACLVKKRKPARELARRLGSGLEIRMMNGTMTIGHGMNRIGILSGLVPFMIGSLTGHASMTTGVIGLRTGPGTLRTGGQLARMVPRAQLLSLRTLPRMNHHRMFPL